MADNCNNGSGIGFDPVECSIEVAVKNTAIVSLEGLSKGGLISADDGVSEARSVSLIVFYIRNKRLIPRRVGGQLVQ